MENGRNLNLRDILQSERVHYNLAVPRLVEAALKNKEAILTSTGALSVATGKYTGRSPNDRYIVDDETVRGQIAWGEMNRPFDEEKFDHLYEDMMNYMRGKEWFVFDGFVGADPAFRMPVRVVNEYAWHNLFARQMFIRPLTKELMNHHPEYTVICAPRFKADPKVHGARSETFIVIHLTKKVVLIGGTEYAGEMKKSIFSVMNYLLPEQGVLPMHCSANVGERGDVALFFGLSGTGKTTLSTDPDRRLIGDDEHGWSDHGVFNMEGGCYAKCIRLSKEDEPQIWDAIRFGSVLENVVVDERTRIADYDDGSLTENTRVAYPIDYIQRSIIPGVAGRANAILFLTADAFGVLPPISKLTKEQAMYYFLSGYTSKLAGTERGVSKPEATFSACFGAPFLPLSPTVYAQMLGEKIAHREARVYLVNTGWTGGAHGVGSRIRLEHTRAMVAAALDGSIENAECETDPIFGVSIPRTIAGTPSKLLLPKNTWANQAEFERTAKRLATLFAENFKKFGDAAKEIAKAGPII